MSYIMDAGTMYQKREYKKISLQLYQRLPSLQ